MQVGRDLLVSFFTGADSAFGLDVTLSADCAFSFRLARIFDNSSGSRDSSKNWIVVTVSFV